ncbi:MAG TPA: hypothetical protein VIW47_06595 [Nitrospiraceae bacterium]|jgi:hypothetical protein
MRYVVMAMLMTLTGFELSLAGAATPEQRESLRGLQGVEVVIEDIKPDAQADGLSQESLRAAVELILRSRGIRVLTQSERSDMPAQPSLSVHLVTDKHSSGQYSFNARVELRQAVSLVSRPQHIVLAPTWSTPDMFRTVGQQNLRLWIINSIEPLVREFVDDFRAVHPR